MRSGWHLLEARLRRRFSGKLHQLLSVKSGDCLTLQKTVCYPPAAFWLGITRVFVLLCVQEEPEDSSLKHVNAATMRLARSSWDSHLYLVKEIEV
jgi:hypothetical protein